MLTTDVTNKIESHTCYRHTEIAINSNNMNFWTTTSTHTHRTKRKQWTITTNKNKNDMAFACELHTMSGASTDKSLLDSAYVVFIQYYYRRGRIITECMNARK